MITIIIPILLFFQPRPQLPVICYHQIRDWKSKDRPRDKEYIMPPAVFRAHLKMLADSGYHTILPDQLYAYQTKGTPLPSKPIMLTFDDAMRDQFKVARPELARYGFKGVFFITIRNLSKNPGYMDRQQVKQLADEWQVIGCHAMTHADIRKLPAGGWYNEVDQAKKELENLTGGPVQYFAYPFGSWKSSNLPMVNNSGFSAAFQLDAPKDVTYPLLTIRRLTDDGRWDTATFYRKLKQGFSPE